MTSWLGDILFIGFFKLGQALIRIQRNARVETHHEDPVCKSSTAHRIAVAFELFRGTDDLNGIEGNGDCAVLGDSGQVKKPVFPEQRICVSAEMSQDHIFFDPLDQSVSYGLIFGGKIVGHLLVRNGKEYLSDIIGNKPCDLVLVLRDPLLPLCKQDLNQFLHLLVRIQFFYGFVQLLFNVFDGQDLPGISAFWFSSLSQKAAVFSKGILKGIHDNGHHKEEFVI